MTYSHAIMLSPASETGGLSIKVGEPFELSKLDPDGAFRELFDVNAHVRGAIIEKVQGQGIRETLGLKRDEGILIRTRVSGGKASYTLLLSSPFAERSTK